MIDPTFLYICQICVQARLKTEGSVAGESGYFGYDMSCITDKALSANSLHKKMRNKSISFHTDNIAILLAAYNGEKYISQQLDSLLAQSYTNWELFIHDDGSSDTTSAIIGKYAASYPGTIHILEAPSCGGAKENFFYLMSEINAPYIMFCDQDDVWLPDKIERSLKALKALEEKMGSDVPLLVFSDAAVVDNELHLMDKSFLHYQVLSSDRLDFSEILVQNVVSGNASLFNRPLLKAALQYTDVNSIIIHDWWCAMIAAYFGAIGFIAESTLLYRQHGSNHCGAKKYTGPEAISTYVRHFRSVKASLYAIRVQADEFSKAFRLDRESLPVRYVRAAELGKAQRMIFYFRNRIRKSGLIRNIGFYLFG